MASNVPGGPSRGRSVRHARQTVSPAELHAADVAQIKADAIARKARGTASEDSTYSAYLLAAAHHSYLCDLRAVGLAQVSQAQPVRLVRVYNEKPIGLHGWDFIIALVLAYFAHDVPTGIIVFILSLLVSCMLVVTHMICRLIKRICQDRPYQEWFA